MILWEVGFLPGHITIANRKVYLAGIGETDDFRLRALRCSRKEEKSDEFGGTRTEPTIWPPPAFTSAPPVQTASARVSKAQWKP